MTTNKKQLRDFGPAMPWEKYSLHDVHAGNENFFGDLLAAYQVPLQHHIKKFIGVDDRVPSAADIVQETIIRLWRHKKQVREYSAVASYLYRTATRLSYYSCDRLIHKNTQNLGEDAEDITDGDVLAKQIEDAALVESIRVFAEEKMVPNKREAFLRKFYYNRTTEEIADALGWKQGTVRSVCERAQKIVQKNFDLY